jgi:hypothetical protein
MNAAETLAALQEAGISLQKISKRGLSGGERLSDRRSCRPRDFHSFLLSFACVFCFPCRWCSDNLNRISQAWAYLLGQRRGRGDVTVPRWVT